MDFFPFFVLQHCGNECGAAVTFDGDVCVRMKDVNSKVKPGVLYEIIWHKITTFLLVGISAILATVSTQVNLPVI